MKRKLLAILFLMLYTASCNPLDDSNLPGLSVPMSEMNTVFRINDLPILENSHINGEPLTLQVENLSQTRVEFPGNFNLKIFRKKDKTWVEVDNIFSYPTGQRTLPTKAELGRGIIADLVPRIADTEKSELIRVVLIGYKNSVKSDLVGAYIDIQLLP